MKNPINETALHNKIYVCTCQCTKSAQQCLAWFGSRRKPFDFTVQAWWSPWMLLVKDLSRWPNTWPKKRAALNIFLASLQAYGKSSCQTLHFTKRASLWESKSIRKETISDRGRGEWEKDAKMQKRNMILILLNALWGHPDLSALNNHCHNKIECRR